MTTQQITLVATVVYTVMLGVTIYLTRATTRRALAALAGGVSVAVAGFGVEAACQSLGLWRYPSDNSRIGPISMYPALILMFAVLALIGWRIVRRFGWRGEIVFLVVIAILGTVRDYRIAEATGLIEFAPGIMPIVVDLFAWSGLTALAQGVMRLIAGPATADRLAREPT